MNASQFSDMWRVMSTYTFQIDPDILNEDLFCIICKKLMIDACQSVCGCQFCFQCIEQYLGNENRCCPGGKEECNERFLVLAQDISRIVRMNNKICKIVVLCPNEFCSLELPLVQMCEHLQVCTNQPMECPYAAIGCDNEERTRDRILAHLNSNMFSHNQLLISTNNNLKNDVNELKLDTEISKLEVEALKNLVRAKDIQVANQLVQMKAQNRDLIKIFYIQKKEIQLMKTELVKKERKITELERKSDKRIYNLSILCPDVDADFVWRISDFTEKMESLRDKRLYSGSFYAFNYKLCLYIYSRGDSNVRLCCMIMVGEHDSLIQWPMQLMVTFGMVNDDGVRARIIEAVQYESYNYDKSAFERPISGMNSYGFGTWLPCDYFNRRKSAVDNDDSIVITCVLTEA